MKPVKTQPRYKCDFCKYRSTKHVMEKHELRCYRNPDRFCDYCENVGYTIECHGDLIEKGDCGLSERIDCPYCSKFDKKMLKEIEEREGKIIVEEKVQTEHKINVEDIPF